MDHSLSQEISQSFCETICRLLISCAKIDKQVITTLDSGGF